MAISLQADSTLPQGYILVDGQRAATISTTGLSATLAANTVTTSALASGAVTTEKIALGAVITADLADGAVTAAKMSGGQSGSAPVYGCRAWVNFNGSAVLGTVNAPSTESITVVAGSSTGTFNVGTTFSHYSGVIYKITSIGGVAGATLGGVDVTTTGIQILSANTGTQYAIRLLSGPALTNQTITGNNTSSGFVYNGTGIRGSGNVSSVTKNSTGVYTINFTTPMSDANYCIQANITDDASSNRGINIQDTHTTFTTQSSVRVTVFTLPGGTGVNAAVDSTGVYLAIFR
jgi:hypothetical protein